MELVKSQISNSKLQINPKLQNSNPKQISEFNESNRFDCPWKATFALSSAQPKLPVPIQNPFGSLELGIWILFVICFLVLGIFYIQVLTYF
jgi:hypothetical protein